MKSKILFLALFLITTCTLNAKIKVATALGDNMVMQRNTEVKLWGTALPNQKLTIRASWNKSKVTTQANDKGEWIVKVKTTEAGGPYKINITSGKEKIQLQNILLGEVWLCSGQSNMEMTMRGFTDQPINGSTETLAMAQNSQIRLFTVKRNAQNNPQNDCNGNWEIATAETVANFSAVGYYFAKRLQETLKIPIGVINSSWGGSRIEAWIDAETMQKHPESLSITTQEKTAPNHRASNLYNGMIYPIKNIGIKGVIWYQGESNRSEYQYYADLSKAMTEKWKSDFELDVLPFYFVQIAPYSYSNSNDILSGKFYDAQLKAATIIPDAGIVASVDYGEEHCIHPAEKEMIAQRLSYWAFSETYHIKGLAYKNPVYKSMEIKDSSVVVSFDNIENGLSSYGKEINNFEIAGDDKVFYPAKAKIRSRQITLTSPEAPKPIAVRYCYKNYPSGKGFVYNTAGKPILPFRSDNW